MEGYFISFWGELVILLAIGPFVGSFLNVVALSIPDFRKIIAGRSACPQCQHQLKWYELIPIISYLIQFGRCRNCRRNIARSYLVVEIATSLVFGLTYLQLQPLMSGGQFGLLLLIISLGIIIYLFDARTMYIQNESLYLNMVLIIFWRLSFGWPFLFNALVAAVLAALFMFILRLIASHLVRQEAMGTGDIYVAAMIGLLVGSPKIYVAIFLSFLIGSLIGLAVLAAKGKKKSRYTAIPFAPSLVLAGWLALLYGQPIIYWYLGYYL